ncbi:hypothetical protein Tco_0562730 [Tanacetum coccineum]
MSYKRWRLNSGTCRSRELTSLVTLITSKNWHCFDAIRIAYDLIDQVVRAAVARDADNKRKWEDDQRRNSGQNKRHEVVRAYVARSSDNKGYVGTLPLYDKCKLHHHHGHSFAQCGK